MGGVVSKANSLKSYLLVMVSFVSILCIILTICTHCGGGCVSSQQVISQPCIHGSQDFEIAGGVAKSKKLYIFACIYRKLSKNFFFREVATVVGFDIAKIFTTRGEIGVALWSM